MSQLTMDEHQKILCHGVLIVKRLVAGKKTFKKKVYLMDFLFQNIIPGNAVDAGQMVFRDTVIL